MVPRYLGFSLVLLSFILLNACSSSSKSGGGSAVDPTPSVSGGGTTGSGGTATSGYSENDLTGTWNYIANQQGGGKFCGGIMTFSGTRLTEYTNSCCPGNQIVNAEFWIWSDGYVKGRNWAWCTNTQQYSKYSMNFTGNDKRRISGLMDVHDDPSYTRFDISFTR
jgi:hypothetical protein